MATLPRIKAVVFDTPLNVNRARAAGWQALLFNDAAKLQRNISNLLG